MRGVVSVEIEVIKHSLDRKIFQSIENSENGEVSSESIFHYHQNNEIVSADYKGGNIRKGHLLGKMFTNGNLEFTYQHMNIEGAFNKALQRTRYRSLGELGVSESK